MLVSHSRKWIYTGPPKTGTSTCHQWLQTSILFNLLTDERLNPKHRKEIPPNCWDYTICVSCRDEEARFHSWYVYKTTIWLRQNRTDKIVSFEDFKKNSTRYRPQETYFPSRVDYWIHTETLEHDLLNLPFITLEDRPKLKPVPHKYQRDLSALKDHCIRVYGDLENTPPFIREILPP